MFVLTVSSVSVTKSIDFAKYLMAEPFRFCPRPVGTQGYSFRTQPNLINENILK